MVTVVCWIMAWDLIPNKMYLCQDIESSSSALFPHFGTCLSFGRREFTVYRELKCWYLNRSVLHIRVGRRCFHTFNYLEQQSPKWKSTVPQEYFPWCDWHSVSVLQWPWLTCWDSLYHCIYGAVTQRVWISWQMWLPKTLHDLNWETIRSMAC